MDAPTPTRIPIRYLILAVLIIVSVVPLLIYGFTVVDNETNRLKTNEMLLQNTITRSLGQDLAQRQNNLVTMMANLTSAIQVASGGNLAGAHINAPELRALLEKFVSSSDNIAYATLVSSQSKGISAGRIVLDDFLRRELEHAFAAAAEGRGYSSPALQIGAGKDSRTVILASSPIMVQGRFIGMMGVVVDQAFLVNRLHEVSQGGLFAYVVDGQGRLVAGGNSNYVTGQDMRGFDIVKNFVDQGGKARFVATREFAVKQKGESQEMLGTYSPVPSLEWAVVAQKPQRDAYEGDLRRNRRCPYGVAGLAGSLRQLGNQYLCRAQHQRSGEDAHRIQPRHRQG